MSQPISIYYISHADTDLSFYQFLLNSYDANLYVLNAVKADQNLKPALTKNIPACILFDSADPSSISQWLKEIKSHPECQDIPIILLTTIDDTARLIELINQGISTYLIKQTISAEVLHFAIQESKKKQTNKQRPENFLRKSMDALPNSEEFIEAFAYAISHARQRQRLVGLLLVNFDSAKKSNLTAEQQTSLFDSFLNYVTTFIRAGDTISLVKPNVLAIILPDINKFADANTVATRILLITDRFLDVEKHCSDIQIKIGVSCFPIDGTSPEQLLKSAEKALDLATAAAGSNVQGSAQIAEHKSLSSSMNIIDNLYHALERNELYLRYQPIFELATRKVVGVEALLRWDHPLLGSIAPSEFIPFAEKSGLIIPIGQWVVSKASEQFQIWRKQNIPLQRLYLNISSLQLKEKDFVQNIMEILHATGTKPGEISLEITDIALMNNLGIARDQILYLQALGVHIAIDDFGGGFSSLSYFEALPANAIKIDRSFINGVPGNPQDNAVVSSVITLSNNFAVTVIAEGIETPEQLNFLVENNCTLGQGFLLCRPLLSDDFSDYFHNQAVS